MHKKCYLEETWREEGTIYITDLKGIGSEGVEWFHLAQERILWQARVNMI
jgi:hypothetical protein